MITDEAKQEIKEKVEEFEKQKPRFTLFTFSEYLRETLKKYPRNIRFELTEYADYVLAQLILENDFDYIYTEQEYTKLKEQKFTPAAKEEAKNLIIPPLDELSNIRDIIEYHREKNKVIKKIFSMFSETRKRKIYKTLEGRKYRNKIQNWNFVNDLKEGIIKTYIEAYLFKKYYETKHGI